MNEEKTKKELISEKEDKAAAEKERKILNILIPVLGFVSFILGLTGTILTATNPTPISNQVAILVCYIILTLFGVFGILYFVLVLIRRKNPDFLRKKKEEEPSPLSD